MCSSAHINRVYFTDPMGLDDTAATYSPRQTSQERYDELMGKLQMQLQSAIAIGMRAFQIEKRTEAMQRTEKRFEGWLSEHPNAAQKLANWGSQVEKASEMFTEWATGNDQTERVFGPNSPQSQDMRSDPMYAKYSERARSSGQEQVVPFGPVGALRSGLHPTRQFVGGYTIVPNVSLGNNHATVIYNATSLKSFLYHLPGVQSYDRGMFPTPGGNTYQYYITEIHN